MDKVTADNFKEIQNDLADEYTKKIMNSGRKGIGTVERIFKKKEYYLWFIIILCILAFFVALFWGVYNINECNKHLEEEIERITGMSIGGLPVIAKNFTMQGLIPISPDTV